MKLQRSVFAVLAFSGLSSCTDSPEPEHSIRYDSHSLVELQDVSGLAAGNHSLEFDAYLPRNQQWTQKQEEQMRQSVRVAHVSTQTPATPQVSSTAVAGRTDLRRVRVDVTLDRPGAWAIQLAGRYVAPASVEPFVQAHYDFLEPQALGSDGDPSRSVPNQFLRTIGACNHVYKAQTLSDSDRTLRRLKLFFSEPILQEGWVPEVKLDLLDLQGRHLRRLEPGAPRVTAQAVEFEVPAQPDVQGRLQVSLSGGTVLAGAFTRDFTCEPAAASLEVGYSYRDQPDVERLVTPIASAVGLAFDGPKSK